MSLSRKSWIWSDCCIMIKLTKCNWQNYHQHWFPACLVLWDWASFWACVLNYRWHYPLVAERLPCSWKEWHTPACWFLPVLQLFWWQPYHWPLFNPCWIKWVCSSFLCTGIGYQHFGLTRGSRSSWKEALEWFPASWSKQMPQKSSQEFQQLDFRIPRVL